MTNREPAKQEEELKNDNSVPVIVWILAACFLVPGVIIGAVYLLF